MTNQVLLIGRLVSNPKINETENGVKVSTIQLEVTRNFKNSQGEYETDIIPCTLWKQLAQGVCEYVEKGDLIGIKGRLQIRESKIEVIVERITFLGQKKEV